MEREIVAYARAHEAGLGQIEAEWTRYRADRNSASLSGLSMSQRIVAIAKSQVGYSTEPTHSYCNKFSAYWHAGTADCAGGEMSEEERAWADDVLGVATRPAA